MFASNHSNSSYETLSSTMSEKRLACSTYAVSSKSSTKPASMMKRLVRALKEPFSEDPNAPKLTALEELEALRASSGHPTVKAYHFETKA